MKNTTTKAYTEVLELLKFFSTEQVKKIPEIKLKVFLKYRDESYSYKIDETKSFEVLGKTPKKDEKSSKATFVKFFGLDESRNKLGYYCQKCCDILESNRFESKIFKELIKNIEMRVD